MELLDAFRLAEKLHSGELDKAGKPILGHLVRVLLRVQAAGGDLNQQIAALLHDAIESGRTTSLELIAEGVPPAAVDLVFQLSRPAGLNYFGYIEEVACKPRAALIKCCDLMDNSDPARLAQLPAETAKSLGKRYARAIEILSAPGA